MTQVDYGEDFLQRIVAVHWREPEPSGEGLAVEFTKRPDYLTLKRELTSMNKVVISFWFRVPSQTAAIVKASDPGFYWEYPVFNGVIPLLTWGQQQTTPVSGANQIDTGAVDVSGGAIIIYSASAPHQAPLQPSCIGVYAGGVIPVLDVHILTNAHATGTDLYSLPTAWTGDFVGNDIHTGKPVYTNIVYTTTDFSYAITEEPEYFGNDVHAGGYPEVITDQWHHLLLSWDLQTGLSKMWCALDDVNKNGNDLPAMNDSSIMGPNDHVSQTPYLYGDKAHADFGDGNVSSDPVQIPAPPSAERASNESGGTAVITPIATIELAELQVFTGVTLDVSIESNRRAFISVKGEPVVPAEAEKLLKQKPVVLLNSSVNWIKGNNTGRFHSLIDERDPYDFTPVGDIKAYKPQPSLHGPQFPIS